MLWAQGKTNAAVRLERLWDDVAKQHELDILCAYPASNFPGGKDERAFNACEIKKQLPRLPARQGRKSCPSQSAQNQSQLAEVMIVKCLLSLGRIF